MTRADFFFLLAILVAAYPNAALAQSKPRVIHVLVALADRLLCVHAVGGGIRYRFIFDARERGQCVFAA
jgi:hypothetical protein